MRAAQLGLRITKPSLFASQPSWCHGGRRLRGQHTLAGPALAVTGTRNLSPAKIFGQILCGSHLLRPRPDGYHRRSRDRRQAGVRAGRRLGLGLPRQQAAVARHPQRGALPARFPARKKKGLSLPPSRARALDESARGPDRPLAPPLFPRAASTPRRARTRSTRSRASARRPSRRSCRSARRPTRRATSSA